MLSKQINAVSRIGWLRSNKRIWSQSQGHLQFTSYVYFENETAYNKLFLLSRIEIIKSHRLDTAPTSVKLLFLIFLLEIRFMYFISSYILFPVISVQLINVCSLSYCLVYLMRNQKEGFIGRVYNILFTFNYLPYVS